MFGIYLSVFLFYHKIRVRLNTTRYNIIQQYVYVHTNIGCFIIIIHCYACYSVLMLDYSIVHFKWVPILT